MSEGPLEKARRSIADAHAAVDDAVRSSADTRRPGHHDPLSESPGDHDHGVAAPGLDLGDGLGHTGGGPTDD